MAPIGADIEPIDVPREDVEVRREEDGELVETEVPRARVNPRIPPVNGNKNMKILDMLSAESSCPACVRGRGIGVGGGERG